MASLRDFLRLVRLPGIFTAQADIAAAFLVAGGTSLTSLALLLAATSLFYAAGMALNDYYDFAIDLRERPDRPLPSGRITRNIAFALGLAALFSAVLLCGLAGRQSLLVGIILAGCIFAYDRGLKHYNLVGPACMGSCRYLNFLLGLSVAPFACHTFLLPLMGGIYVFGITLLSRKETEPGPGSDAIVAAACSVMLAVMLYSILFWYSFLPNKAGIIAVNLWALALFALLFNLFGKTDPAATRKTVSIMLLGLVLLDGIIVLGTREPLWALPVWGLCLPSVIAARKFYLT